MDYKFLHALWSICPSVCGGHLESPGSCSSSSHPPPLLRRVRYFPSHQSLELEMRLGAGAPRLPKHRLCLLGAPGVEAPGSSPRPPVLAPLPCPVPQGPRAPLGGPPCTHPCTRPGPAPPGPREQHHPQAPVVASGEPPGGVVLILSATASWVPLVFTGARCRVRGPWENRGWGLTSYSAQEGAGDPDSHSLEERALSTVAGGRERRRWGLRL